MREIILNARYLLDFQREALLKQIDEQKTDGEEESKVDVSELLDTLLFKMLGSSIHNLSPMERVEINYILQDLGYETI